MPHKKDLTLRSIYSFWSDRWVMSRLYLEEGKATERDIARVRHDIREILPELPGVKLEVMDSGPMWRQDRGKRIAFQITGEDSEVLAELASEAKDRIATIPGLLEPFSGMEGATEELIVSVDRDLASRYGVNARQPSDVVQLTYRGRQLPRFRTPDGERPMRLTLDETQDESVGQLRNLPIYTSDGARVPLASLADFQYKKGAEAVHRDNRVTSVWVGARYEDGTREDYVPVVQDALSKMDFPYGYEWSFTQVNQRRAEQSREFMINLLLALLLIFAVMAGLFESMGQAIALLIALPFAISGAFWTLWLTGCDLDQPAAVGLLLLIGIVVNNGIVMLEHINLYRRRGVRRSRAMLRGGRERLRPILMTALTTLIGLVPIVVQKPALAGVYYYSMALVIMGGLLVSTVLTLVLLPTTAILIEDSPHGVARFIRWTGRKLFRRGRPVPASHPA
ncbi:MAG: efflux RND transporter permease subunit [Candidatus Eisenbacteria bacterium]|uniref:Efflux RND transporter permease subunit n=1 Tax=Eiseniibacteriota bacterium TaxID=2212470 RepID=A0A956LY88_UNCEI|nr:efflux RND transporter permease subunit [Candidatus Eisenbacteria bacterium]